MLHKMLTQARTSLPSAESSLCTYSLCSFLLPNVRSKRIPWVNRMGLKSLENFLEARLDLHAWWNLPFRIRSFLLNLNETQRKENLSHSLIFPLQREFFWGIRVPIWGIDQNLSRRRLIYTGRTVCAKAQRWDSLAVDQLNWGDWPKKRRKSDTKIRV